MAEVHAERPVWLSADAEVTGSSGRLSCSVQLRAHGMVSPAVVTVAGDGVLARLERPQRGVAAGQALVLYDGDVVLGSATITGTVPVAPVPITSPLRA